MDATVLGHPITLDHARVADPPATIRAQLDEYTAGHRHEFTLTIRFPDGFTGTVHRELCRIPYGTTRTYRSLARTLDTAPIAIGGACARNPLPIIIPCHRVTGVSSLRGYQYPGLQQPLIDHEHHHATPTDPHQTPLPAP